MATTLRSLLALLTAVSALAAGALNGRVLCMAGAERIAIEEPHSDSAHSPSDHGCAGEGEANHDAPDHQSVPDGGCMDIQAGGTLVRETALTVYDHQHARLALPVALPALSADLLSAHSPSRHLKFAGAPPALAYLARLGSIILLV